MAYTLNGITIRTNNSKNGLKKIEEIWKDIESGKLPILFDSEKNLQKGISPISIYSNYSSDEKGDYDFSVVGVKSDFFSKIEEEVKKGLYKKYDISDDNGNIEVCTKNAWKIVWEDMEKGSIKRAFTIDYEISVPAEYSKDGKAHCYLYIALKK